MKQLLSIFIFLIIISFINAQSCIYNNSAINQVYNLTSLALPNSYYTAPTGDTIYFNLCNTPTSKCISLGATASGCQQATNLNILYYTTDTPSVDFTDNGLNLNFVGPSAGCFNSDGKRHTTMHFNCNPNEKGMKVTSNSEILYCYYHIYIDTNLVCKKCPLDCSSSLSQGTCDPFSGQCNCNNNTIFQYDGNGCEISKLYISSVKSTTTEGGETVITGSFASRNTSNLSIKIGSSECTNIQRSINGTLKCIAPKGEVGKYDVTISDGGFSYTSKNAFSYIPIINTCPNNCSGPTNGICQTDTSLCQCIDPYNGYDCSAIKDVTNPNSSINILPGEVIFSNEDSNYQIELYSVVEFDYNNIMIREYILKNRWNVTNSDVIDGNKIIKYTQLLGSGGNGNTSIVEYTIEQVNNIKKSYTFAGLNFTVDPNSIKFTIAIKNYQYLSTLNRVQLRIRSIVGDNDNGGTTNKCNIQSLETNNDFENTQIFNYFTIRKDKKLFQSRFINRVESDGNNAFISSEVINSTDGTYLIGLNLPMCIKSCFIDPDFSLLVESNYQKSCDDDDSRPKWFLPVVIAVPIVGLSLIIIISAIVYKKHSVSIKILKQELKLKNLNNN